MLKNSYSMCQRQRVIVTEQHRRANKRYTLVFHTSQSGGTSNSDKQNFLDAVEIKRGGGYGLWTPKDSTSAVSPAHPKEPELPQALHSEGD